MFRSLFALTLAVCVAPAARAGAVVVELFTSQSCSSCPAAEALLRDIAKKEGVVVLEWHVDYWNDIDVGREGRWKDPFSSPDHTARQRAYNRRLRKRGNGYTPQVVVDGQAETVGSRRADLLQLIESAAIQNEAAPAIAIAAEKDRLSIGVGPAPNGIVSIVYFRREVTTRVAGGENAGRTLPEVNVVTSAETLGPAAGGAVYSADAPRAGEGCAVLVQQGSAGPILGARYCS